MNVSMNNLGFSLGFVFGVSMFLFAMLSMFFGVGTPIVALMGSLYIGYAASYVGAFLGLLFGFAHGYITGAAIVYVSDYMAKH